MKREELDRKFDEALAEAFNERKWTGSGRIPYAVAALAIAVRGLWPEKPADSPKDRP